MEQVSAQPANARHAALLLHAEICEQHELLMHALHAVSLAVSEHAPAPPVVDVPEPPPLATPPKMPGPPEPPPVTPGVPDVPDVPDAPDVPEVPPLVPVPVVVPLHAATPIATSARSARVDAVNVLLLRMEKS